jgi:16S rRNA (uracil1498-N3)-methyltransferase
VHRFFVDPADWRPSGVILRPEEAHHMFHVLRLKPGAALEVFDGNGRIARGEAPERPPSGVLRRDGVEIAIGEAVFRTPPATRLVLVQAFAKARAMETILEKAVELGVGRIVPFVAARSVPRAAGGDAGGWAGRLGRIVLNAAKQCGSAYLPIVEPPRDAAAAAGLVSSLDVALVGSLESGAPPLAGVLASVGRGPASAGVVIGPEGDMTQEELSLFRAAGARPASFGGLVFRVETAATFALGVLAFWFGACGPGSAEER